MIYSRDQRYEFLAKRLTYIYVSPPPVLFVGYHITSDDFESECSATFAALPDMIGKRLITIEGNT